MRHEELMTRISEAYVEGLREGLKNIEALEEIGHNQYKRLMTKMWMDNVLTDGEYNRIMDKLNTYWSERRADE